MALPVGDQREVERWAEDAALVADVTRALARSRGSRTARRVVCEGAARLADAPVAMLLEATPGGLVLVVSEVLGADVLGAEVWIGDPVSGAARAIRKGHEVVTRTTRAAGAERDLLRRAGVRTAAWHPVGRALVHSAVLAVAWRDRIGMVPPRVSSMLDLLAAEAEFAIGRAADVDRLQRMVRTDELTGLPNRRALEEQLPRELARARREGSPLSIAMVDLDHFKDFNDRHGHLAGDRHLKRATAAWRQVLRPYDVLARFGGEEFVAIMPGCDLRAASEVIERLRSATPSGETASAGVVEWVLNEHPDVLVSRADTALYDAKRAGRHRTVAAPRRGRAVSGGSGAS